MQIFTIFYVVIVKKETEGPEIKNILYFQSGILISIVWQCLQFINITVSFS